MRLKVWWVDDNDDIKEIVSSNHYLVDLILIQKVVDKYENSGITIDQGGDDDFYEFHLVDWNNEPNSIYNEDFVLKFINDIQDSLS